MKISYHWLRQYLSVDLPVSQISSILTNCGLEVEGIETYVSIKGGMKGLVVGEVKTCMKHPGADKLSLTTVDIGSGPLLNIVCGAPNIAAGQKVIVAPVGTTVHPTEGAAFEIKKSKIRGEVSEGMICAEDEIGLGISHAGVLVLPAETRVGMAAAEFFNVEEDTIFEIGLTPNRADAASHIGVARDLAAVIRTSALVPDPPLVVMPLTDAFSVDDRSLPISVEVLDPEACPRYSGISISGVTVKESPAWLKNKLKSIGVGPVNNIVDITNYVLHECGQPLHAFDADKITGNKVVVRAAKTGEKFITLDGVERTLGSGELMICNDSQPMCIAGVFGGLHSGISETTKNVFLESAYFSPASIRKTGKHHGLKTDASFRFERGADPAITVYALKRAASIIREIAGGSISSEIVDVYPKEILPAEVRLDFAYLDRFSGAVIERKKIRELLVALGISILKEDHDGLLLRIPLYKVDVTRPVDVVEEILRIHGYNLVPLPAKQHISLPAIVEFDRDKLQNRISDYLVANGFQEILSNSLTRTKYVEAAGWDAGATVSLMNPLSQDLAILRQGMISSGLEAIEFNRNRRQSNLRLFEFGKTYGRSEGKYRETMHLALYVTGKKFESNWTGDPTDTNFYFLKSFVMNILAMCGIGDDRLTSEVCTDPSLSAGLSLKAGNQALVNFGSVSKKQLKLFDISQDVFCAEFNWDLVARKAKRKPAQYIEIPKYPQVRRDLSMVIDREIPYSRIESIAYQTERKLLREVHLFDVYEGEKIDTGKKSCALTFILQDDQQTLTDKQIEKTMERLMAAYEKEAGAVIRRA